MKCEYAGSAVLMFVYVASTTTSAFDFLIVSIAFQPVFAPGYSEILFVLREREELREVEPLRIVRGALHEIAHRDDRILEPVLPA